MNESFFVQYALEEAKEHHIFMSNLCAKIYVALRINHLSIGLM